MSFKILSDCPSFKEVFLHVLSFLTAEDLLISRLVCKQFKELSDDEYLWKEQCIKKEIKPIHPDTFKTTYIGYLRIFHFFRLQVNLETPKTITPNRSLSEGKEFAVQLLEQWFEDGKADEEAIQNVIETIDTLPSDDALLNRALVSKFSPKIIDLLLQKGSLPSRRSFEICSAQKNVALLEKLYLCCYATHPVRSTTLSDILQLRLSEKTVFSFIHKCIDPITKLHLQLALNNDHPDTILYSLIAQGAFYKINLLKIPANKRDLLIAIFLEDEVPAITKNFLRQFLYLIHTLSPLTVEKLVAALSKTKYKLSFMEFIKFASKKGLNPNVYRQLVKLANILSFEKYPFFLEPPVCQALVQAAIEENVRVDANTFLLLVLVLPFFDSEILKLPKPKNLFELLKFNLQTVFDRLFQYFLKAETEITSLNDAESALITEKLVQLTTVMCDLEQLNEDESTETFLKYRQVFGKLCTIQSDFLCSIVNAGEFFNLLSFFEKNVMQSCLPSTIYAHADEQYITSLAWSVPAGLDDLLLAAHTGFSENLLSKLIENLNEVRDLETILALRNCLPSGLFIQLMKKTKPSFELLIYLLMDKREDQTKVLEACVPKIEINQELLKIAILFEISPEGFKILLNSTGKLDSKFIKFAEFNRNEFKKMIIQRRKFLAKRARGFQNARRGLELMTLDNYINTSDVARSIEKKN